MEYCEVGRHHENLVADMSTVVAFTRDGILNFHNQHVWADETKIPMQFKKQVIRIDFQSMYG